MLARTSALALAIGTIRRSARSPLTVPILWLANIAAFCGLIVWMLADGRFMPAAVLLRNRFRAFFEVGMSAATYTWYAERSVALAIVGVVAVGSAAGIFLALFLGAHTHRRVRSWFAFTVLLAAWLTLAVSWQEITWRGQVYRLHHKLDGFEAIAQSLRADWPLTDGDRPRIGPFMAYPIGGPTMIMTLATPDVPGTNTSFATVERGNNGTLRFELEGNEPDVWLEWHPPGSQPQSFIGGLGDDHLLERVAPLGRGWFLARY